jgi:hypothetical protein
VIIERQNVAVPLACNKDGDFLGGLGEMMALISSTSGGERGILTYLTQVNNTTALTLDFEVIF